MLISGRELSPQITFIGHRVTHYTIAGTVNGFIANAKAMFMLVTCINSKKKTPKKQQQNLNESNTKSNSLDLQGIRQF